MAVRLSFLPGACLTCRYVCLSGRTNGMWPLLPIMNTYTCWEDAIQSQALGDCAHASTASTAAGASLTTRLPSRECLHLCNKGIVQVRAGVASHMFKALPTTRLPAAHLSQTMHCHQQSRLGRLGSVALLRVDHAGDLGHVLVKGLLRLLLRPGVRDGCTMDTPALSISTIAACKVGACQSRPQ